MHYSVEVKFTCLFSSDSDFGIWTCDIQHQWK